MLTRRFLEYCIQGWENLPRTVLMYYVNFISSPEGYFHTVICNSDVFRNTSISHDLHYINWDNPPKQHPLYLTSKDFNGMVKSGMPFARKFAKGDLVLDKIDRELLGRSNGQVTPGGWCKQRSNGAERCSSRADDFKFMPGPGAERLQQLMKKLMFDEFRNGSCSKLQYDQTKRDWIGLVNWIQGYTFIIALCIDIARKDHRVYRGGEAGFVMTYIIVEKSRKLTFL